MPTPPCHVVFPTLIVPGVGNEWIVKPGKPQVLGETITLAQASALVGLSTRQLQAMCLAGDFKSAHRPGHKRGRWLISRTEALARKGVVVA